jgi:ATP-dependent HslUV protease subunit HslV
MFKIEGTTILCVKRDNEVCMVGDGQVTLQNAILKNNAKKLRKIYNDKVIVGFAGAVADAFSLLERFEEKLSKYSGDLKRSAYELAKDWRTDKILRRLEAMMIAADKNDIILISGTGEVIIPDYPVIAIGSGGFYAYSAARALFDNTNLTPKEICEKAMEIASEICIYTNSKFTYEEL